MRTSDKMTHIPVSRPWHNGGGRSYFAGLRMTIRRNKVRNVMFFAIFTDKERTMSQKFTFTSVDI